MIIQDRTINGAGEAVAWNDEGFRLKFSCNCHVKKDINVNIETDKNFIVKSL